MSGRYFENETVLYSDSEIFEHSVRTTKSLLECERFYSKADAQEIADKHVFVVRTSTCCNNTCKQVPTMKASNHHLHSQRLKQRH